MLPIRQKTTRVSEVRSTSFGDFAQPRLSGNGNGMIGPDESVKKLGDATRLTPDSFRAEFRGCESVTFQAGEVLLREGSKEDNCFLIESGSLEITNRTSNGNVVPIGVIWPGDYLGEISMLAGKPRGATATARTKVTAIRFKHSDFIKLLEENDPFATRLSLELCRLLLSPLSLFNPGAVPWRSTPG